MAISTWFELKPFRTDSPTSGFDNMLKILEHLEKFLFLIYKEERAIRIFIKAGEDLKATLSDLEGVEFITAESPELGHLNFYKTYYTKKHCAYLIAGKDTHLTSAYHTLGNVITKPSFLAFYVRKAKGSPQISSFISKLSHGKEPESSMDKMMDVVSSVMSNPQSKNPSMGQKRKIREAESKLASGKIYYARMVVGASTKEDEDIIFGMFPSDAFVAKRIKLKEIAKNLKGSLNPPSWPPGKFGGNHMLVLNSDEITSFLQMPSNDDITSGKFEIGSIPTEASGTREGTVSGANAETDESDDTEEDMVDSTFDLGLEGSEKDHPQSEPQEHLQANHVSFQKEMTQDDMMADMGLADKSDNKSENSKPKDDSEYNSEIKNNSEFENSNQADEVEPEKPLLSPLDVSILHMVFFKKGGMYKEDIIDGVMNIGFYGLVKKDVSDSLIKLTNEMYVKICYPNTNDVEDESEFRKKYVVGEEAKKTYFSPSYFDSVKINNRLIMMFDIAVKNMSEHRCCIHGEGPDLLIIEPNIIEYESDSDSRGKNGKQALDPLNWSYDRQLAVEIVDPEKDIEESVSDYGKNREKDYDVWFVCFDGDNRQKIEDGIREKYQKFERCNMDVVSPKTVSSKKNYIPDTYDEFFSILDVKSMPKITKSVAILENRFEEEKTKQEDLPKSEKEADVAEDDAKDVEPGSVNLAGGSFPC